MRRLDPHRMHLPMSLDVTPLVCLPLPRIENPMHPLSPRAREVLATMSPVMLAALHHIHDGHAHHLHGREVTSLIHRGLIERDPYGCVVITALGSQILTHTKEHP